MRGVFVGITTLDVAQLVATAVAENQKVTSLEQLICAGGPATNAAVTFAALQALQVRVGEAEFKPAQPLLVSALGLGTSSEIIRADLCRQGLEIVDCTDVSAKEEENLAPAVSTIFVNFENGSRTLASTNSRLPLDVEKAVSGVSNCNEEVCVVLVDGHNYALA
ncbi:hypothetical protein HMPREF0044_0083 [Gleimia coleocanis DSM 15436]|uniref:Carbohydrate kinase PfkB domain-containing protein n=1 Tax=Gleimia coleocanis DSM 15436 TaxID=525245 RepID=C0VY43_9ACTO|nr:hypothetical protein [Gleimia coleocanis]EEH64346.1 hypothetical protein HMPREF0044_0083 [Gleimia coleocanis DSM 15436]